MPGIYHAAGLGRLWAVVNLLELYPTTRLKMPNRLGQRHPSHIQDLDYSLVGSAEHPRPVLDGHDGVSGVDVIEMIPRVKPRRLNIVHEEPHIGWQPVRLYG